MWVVRRSNVLTTTGTTGVTPSEPSISSSSITARCAYAGLQLGRDLGQLVPQLRLFTEKCRHTHAELHGRGHGRQRPQEKGFEGEDAYHTEVWRGWGVVSLECGSCGLSQNAYEVKTRAVRNLRACDTITHKTHKGTFSNMGYLAMCKN